MYNVDDTVDATEDREDWEPEATERLAVRSKLGFPFSSSSRFSR